MGARKSEKDSTEMVKREPWYRETLRTSGLWDDKPDPPAKLKLPRSQQDVVDDKELARVSLDKALQQGIRGLRDLNSRRNDPSLAESIKTIEEEIANIRTGLQDLLTK